MSDLPVPGDIDDRAPAVIRRYLGVHDRRDADAALSAFTADATVVDDGQDFVGPDRIRHWLAKASTEFTYTRTLVGAEEIDASTWLITNHLEGNFPGGVVDLRYRFTLQGDLISELLIAP